MTSKPVAVLLALFKSANPSIAVGLADASLGLSQTTEFDSTHPAQRTIGVVLQIRWSTLLTR